MFQCLLLALFLFLSPLTGAVKSNKTQDLYQAKDFTYLKGMPGFSDDLIDMHLVFYRGYVKNTNLLHTTLQELSNQGKEMSYEYGALKRRFSWEFDGMRLHEYYFQNLGGKEMMAENHPLNQKIVKDFGSFDQWKKEFKALGRIRGIGWVVLYYDPIGDRLFNIWIEEHDLGPLAGGKPILVMDVWEHAYITQYGIDRGKYIDVFFDNIDWSAPSQRYAAK